jgi:hypothetical protein
MRYPHFVLKSQDLLVLLKLVGEPSGWTFEKIGADLGLSSSAVHRSLDRAQQAGLYDPGRRAVRLPALLEFLTHGAKYVFPAVMRGEARGIPTAWGAPPLAKKLSSSRRNVPVWPHPKGKVRGIALEPLHPAVAEAARRDDHLAELLALFDAVRIGNARERALAVKDLERRLDVEHVPA